LLHQGSYGGVFSSDSGTHGGSGAARLRRWCCQTAVIVLQKVLPATGGVAMNVRRAEIKLCLWWPTWSTQGRSPDHRSLPAGTVGAGGITSRCVRWWASGHVVFLFFFPRPGKDEERRGIRTNITIIGRMTPSFVLAARRRRTSPPLPLPRRGAWTGKAPRRRRRRGISFLLKRRLSSSVIGDIKVSLVRDEINGMVVNVRIHHP
jgi:hypothetical protein